MYDIFRIHFLHLQQCSLKNTISPYFVTSSFLRPSILVCTYFVNSDRSRNIISICSHFPLPVEKVSTLYVWVGVVGQIYLS